MGISLCLDFGNTRLKVAVFNGRDFQEEINLPEATVASITALMNQWEPKKVILSSVINHDPEIEGIMAAQTTFHRLSHASLLPLTTPVGKPETIGADRLALVASAVDLFPKQHNLVIGLGTCITYNFLNCDGDFLGGAISPGLDLRFRSMHDYTALLPIADPDWNYPLIGYNTNTNLVSGVMNGMLGELEYTIDQYEQRFGNLIIVLTGGRAPYFASRLKKRIFADSHFLFKGLYALSSLNS